MIRHLLLSEDNTIITFTLKPTDKTIDIEISDKQFEEITNKGYNKYKYENGQFIYKQDLVDKMILEEELIGIQGWFGSNDWIPNKIVTGEWETTDIRWQTYLSERLIKRTRQDELKVLLGI